MKNYPIFKSFQDICENDEIIHLCSQYFCLFKKALVLKSVILIFLNFSDPW